MSGKRKQLGQCGLAAVKRSRVGAVSPRAGTIKSLTVRNFMCHSLLEVVFEKNVTVVTGRNGSGKSAILTALVVGLGGKAAATNRGNSIKGFLKAGETWGQVEVVLNNDDIYGYKPQVFGNAISIQRRFTSAGNSSYTIRSEKGEVISKSAKELVRIMSFLNIQIDNPVCILNQDTARSFLNTDEPKHKFKLFKRATRLDLLQEEYRKLHANKVTAVDMLSEKKEALKKMEEEIAELKRKSDQHRSLADKNREVRTLEGELLWSRVRETEREYHEYKTRTEQKEIRLTEMMAKAEENEEKCRAVDEKLSELRRQIVEVKEAVEMAKVPERDAKRALVEMRERLAENKRNAETLKRTAKVKSEMCSKIEADIENAARNITQAENEKAERLVKLARFREELTKIQHLLETSENELFNLKHDRGRNGEEQVNQLKMEISEFTRDINSNCATLETLERESNSCHAVYGRSVVRIVDEISARRDRFRELPRGPLGSYVTLKHKKWALAVESLIGPPLLGAFTVDNEHDNAVLQEIFRKVCGGEKKPTVITSKFFHRLHDMSQHKTEAPAGCESVFDALAFSDPVVANCLVDQCRIETVLLVPDGNLAMRLLSETENVPKNCKSALTVEGDTYYPAPNLRTYSGNYANPKYLQVDVKERARELKKNIDALRQRKQAAENQLQLVLQERRQRTTREGEIEQKIKELRKRKLVIVKKCDDLEVETNQELSSVDHLKSELVSLKNALLPTQSETERLKTEEQEIKRAMNEQEKRLEETSRSLQAMRERVAPLELQVMKQEAKKQELTAARQYVEIRVEEENASLREARSELARMEERLRERTEEAGKVCERGETLRTVPEIVSEIDRIEKSIRKIETEIDKPEEVRKRLKELGERQEVMRELIDSLVKNVQQLQRAERKRRRKYRRTEDFFINSVKDEFEKVLEYRQFKGSLEINMAEEKLELIVIPQQGSQGHSVTTNLSGGERSFSTVAFLYALWSCKDFPFYFLDEFDVYMDKLNRSKVMEILLYHAKQRPQLQFVFLTPQDVSFITDKDVALHKLQDPERGAR